VNNHRKGYDSKTPSAVYSLPLSIAQTPAREIFRSLCSRNGSNPDGGLVELMIITGQTAEKPPDLAGFNCLVIQ
jgi:hypothetical protein